MTNRHLSDSQARLIRARAFAAVAVEEGLTAGQVAIVFKLPLAEVRGELTWLDRLRASGRDRVLGHLLYDEQLDGI